MRHQTYYLNNSIEAVKTGTPQVTLNVFQNDLGLSIGITDNGEGIPSDFLPLIELGQFTNKENGNGMGISGVKKWLQTINGDLKIESTIGFGTNITIFIPS